MISSVLSYFLKSQTETDSEHWHGFEVRKLKRHILMHVMKKSILQRENCVNSFWALSVKCVPSTAKNMKANSSAVYS